jgi:hypothetical protein
VDGRAADLRPGTRIANGQDSERPRRRVASVDDADETLDIPTFLRKQQE